MGENGGGRARVRPVRCPKCDDLLPELENFTAHRCGSWNATVREKGDHSTTVSSSERPYGAKLPHLDDSSNKKGVESGPGSATGRDIIKLDTREGEEEKLRLSPEAIPRRRLTSRIDDRVDSGPGMSGIHDGSGRYRRSSKAPFRGSASSEDGMLQGFRGKRGTRPATDRVPAFCRMAEEEMKSAPSLNYREGSSTLHDGLYREDYSKKKNQSEIGTEYRGQYPVQLLRQLDELRDQISRSREIDEKVREKIPATEVHSKATRNLDSQLRGNHAYGEQHGPKPQRKAPYLLSAHYAERPKNDYLRRQFETDPSISYHHDDFIHHASCHCIHCHHKHLPLPERAARYPITNRSQRHPLCSQNYVPYPVGLQMLRLQEHKEKVARAENLKKRDRRPCQAFAGAAPFVICSSCYELLRLPQIILLVSKKLCKLRCGSCSVVFSIELVGKTLEISTSVPSVAIPDANCSPRVKTNKDAQSKAQNSRKSYASSSEDYSGPYKNIQSIDGSNFSPSTSSHELMEGECKLSLSEADKMKQIKEADKMKGLSSASDRSNNMESLDSTICQQITSSTTEYHFDAEAISDDAYKIKGLSSAPDRSHNMEIPDSTICQQITPSTTECHLDADSPSQDNLVHTLSNKVMDNSENAITKCSDEETTISYSDKLQQSCDNDQAVTEIDLSVREYGSSNLSRDYLEMEKDQNQFRNDNNDDSLVLKKSLQDYSLPVVSVNGHPILDHLVRKAEKQAGRVLPGEYWYDCHAGFWGVMGQPCLGIIPPFIEEFNYPMPKNCACGNTGIFVNGRELHKKDLKLLVNRGLPPTTGKHYVLEFSGNLFDEVSRKKLGDIGRLAPTVEKMGRGFGMRVPF
ncbi:hypothetical protein Cni_G11896 [Canna indica]|uniref:Zinc-ribbon domain-containing protein n=1 Tax=Canna indica TaxID=4628 RepID=A0AAQ3KCJ8_9LILI|nr:hypothetical protein Cni_G11896 [Canna indica]